MSERAAKMGWKMVLPIMAAMLLIGCGGGGDDASTSATPTSSSGTSNTGSGTSNTGTASPSVGSGTATLSWYAPTENTDGTALTDLSGYRIYYGTDADALSQSVDIDTVGITTYVVSNLGTGTWYFAIKAYNAAGVESDLSNVASKTIS